MSRRANPIPSKLLNLALPLDIHTRLSAQLYSDLEQRVPHAAYSRFLVELLRRHWGETHLDLAPWLGTHPGSMTVTGTPETLAALCKHLEEV